MLTVNKKQITNPRQGPNPLKVNCCCISDNNKKSKSFACSRQKVAKPQRTNQYGYCGICNIKTNENKTPSISTPTLQPPSNKLLSAIVQFHNNLSKLPLDLLITHQHPQLWLSEQYATLAQLKEKLTTFINSKNQMKKGGIDGQYYINRLLSVEEMLNNISNNVGMLRNLYQQELNRYGSATSSIDIDSSSLQSSRQCSAKKNESQGMISREASGSRQTSQSKISDRRNLSMSKDGLKSKVNKWEQIYIKDNEKYAKEQSMYEINEPSEGKKDSSSDVYEEMMTNFKTNLKSIKDGNFGGKTTTFKEGEAQSYQRKRSAYGSECETMNFLSTCKSENNQNQTNYLVDNQIQQQDIEDNDSHSQQNAATKRRNQINFQSLSQLIAKSSLMQQNTLRGNPVWHELGQLMNKSQVVNKNKMDIGSLKHLLKEISELKSQIFNKNKQIQSLLITQQQLQSVIQLYKNKEQQKNEAFNYSALRIQNLQTLVDKFEKQISHFKNSDREIRQTMKNQIIFINSLQKQKQDIEKIMNNVRLEMEASLEIAQKKEQQSKAQIKKLKTSERVCHEKMQIYKQKYYSLLHESQLKKIVQDTTYEGKASKVKQIWKLLADHKDNLQKIDEQGHPYLIIQSRDRLSSSLKKDPSEKMANIKQSYLSSSNNSKEALLKNNMSKKYKSISPNASQLNQESKQRSLASFSHLSFPNQSGHQKSKDFIQNGSYSFDPFEKGEIQESF